MKNILIFRLLLPLLSFLNILSGQTSPGGVSGVELWFKTAALTSDLNGSYIWQDFSGDGSVLRNYSSSGAEEGLSYVLPRGRIRTYNFNPALSPTDTGGVINKEVLLRHSNFSQSTILGVFGQSGNFSLDEFAYMFNGRPGSGVISTRSNFIESAESGLSNLEYGVHGTKNLMPSQGESIDDYRETALRSMSYYRSIVPNNGVWGEDMRGVLTLGNFVSSDNNVNSTFSGGSLNAFTGFIPELIVYGRILSPFERRKVESYLALKYALTLDKSYISNSGDLVWDLEENSDYNNRISGVAREDASGLYQEFSSTSYEESSYFSDMSSYDTYYNNDSNNLSTPYRLLFSGRQNASPLNDGDYILWGDNGESVLTDQRSDIIGMNIMQRQWLLKTNMLAADERSKTLPWRLLNLSAGFAFESENFVGTVIKRSGDKDINGEMVTAVPLQTENGYFSFKTSFPLNNGNIEIKFTTVKSESSDYGYRIVSNGGIYRIIGGVLNNTLVCTVGTGQKIEVEKSEKYVYLRVNGIRQLSGTVEIAAADINKEYYGKLAVNKGTQDIVINEFRHGGFCDTGNRLELSYVGQRASEFYPYRSGGKSYLIIDRSGSGDFPAGEVDYYPADALDETRSKIIFDNIFWDPDENGKDVFTFGYKENNLAAEISTINPTCGPKGGASLRNGEIHVKIISGYPGYFYTLTNNSNNSVVESGSFYEDKLIIGKLVEGTYNLTLQEIGGTNLTSTSSSAGVSLTSGAYAAGSSFQFTAIDESQYEIGFTDAATNASAVAVKFGVKYDYHKLFPIIGGVLGSSIGQVNSEDIVKVERTATSLIVKVNDVQIYSQTFSSVTTSMRLGVNQYGAGKILNIKIPTAASQPTWQSGNTGVKTEISVSDQINTNIKLFSGCNVIVFPSHEFAKLEKSDSSLLVYYKQSGAGEERFVRVTLAHSSAADLLVFDMNGRLVYSDSHYSFASFHEFKLKGLVAGTYIVKVITGDGGEYGGKVLVRP